MLNVFLGTLSILALWWVARLWFGAPAAAAAAALLTCSTYHIAFSRAFLTDISFALIFLTAIWVAEAAFRRNSLPVAIAAGLLTGLAWNTKYHGWFVLVIFAGTLLSLHWRQLLSFSFAPEIRRRWLLWAVMAGTASLCYLPWLWFVQSQPGGYVALAKYQRTMLNSHYLTNVWLQVRQQFSWETPLSRLSIPLAILCAALVSRKRMFSLKAVLLMTMVTAVGLLAGSSAAAVIMAAVAVHNCDFSRRRLLDQPCSARKAGGGCGGEAPDHLRVCRTSPASAYRLLPAAGCQSVAVYTGVRKCRFSDDSHDSARQPCFRDRRTWGGILCASIRPTGVRTARNIRVTRTCARARLYNCGIIRKSGARTCSDVAKTWATAGARRYFSSHSRPGPLIR